MSRSAILIPALVIALFLPRAPAWCAEDSEATARLKQGVALYDAGRLDEAISVLKSALALEERAEIFYALGQAQRRKGDCRAAVESYRRAAASPNPQVARAATYQMGRCVATEPTLAAPAALAPASSTPAPAVVVAPAPPPARRSDGAAIGLVVAGGGLVAIGAGLLGWSEALARDATRDLAAWDRAGGVTGLRGGGGALVGVGAALVVGGAVRFAVVRRR